MIFNHDKYKIKMNVWLMKIYKIWWEQQQYHPEIKDIAFSVQDQVTLIVGGIKIW